MRTCLLPSLRLLSVPVLQPRVMVIGSGIAGLSAALAAAKQHEVLLVAKNALSETNTRYAQGGIAAAMREPDASSHLQDTIQAGAGLCDETMVRVLVDEGVLRVDELIRAGVPFDRDASGKDIALTLEGGHTARRILHASGDATGRAIQETLARMVAENPRIQILEHHFTVDLLHRDGVCYGALCMDCRYGRFLRVEAGAVIVATGGIGQVYRETTNPEVATGDGLAMCFRAGAVLRDMEFVQFHPTTLYLAGAPRFLISEAVRGEGAYLRTLDGTRFMPEVHPDGELAPRDVVSRAIVRTMLDTETSHVLLDLRHLDAGAVRRRFPTICALCQRYGIDIATDPIPVRPAAHYMMGGVRIDALGQTSVARLYAAGEAACTGVHGANRLASNSLLEGLVFGHRAGEHAAAQAVTPTHFPGYEEMGEPRTWTAPLDIDDVRDSLKALTWRNLGVFRWQQRIEEAERNIAFWSRYVLCEELNSTSGQEVQNMLTVAMLIARAAALRTESRGAHQRMDYPEPDPTWVRHIDLSVADFPEA